MRFATCPRCGEPVRRLEWINEDEARGFRLVHDDSRPECSTVPRGEQFRVGAIEEDKDVAPRLVISCARCGGEETVNDEEGGCALSDLTGWAAGHQCDGRAS